MSELGESVQRARQAAGISQRELAVRARTSQGAISRIENGLEEPSFERFAQIMRVLGYSPTVDLRPLAEPDAEPRRLLEQSRLSPQQRIDDGLNWLRFARELPSVSATDG